MTERAIDNIRQRTGEFHIRTNIDIRMNNHREYIEQLKIRLWIEAGAHIATCIDDGRRYSIQTECIEKLSTIATLTGEESYVEIRGFIGLVDYRACGIEEWYWAMEDDPGCEWVIVQRTA